jgi:nucleoside phosphorylase
VLRRVPRTLERSGYADDPICVTGLYLLAQSLQHSGGQLLQPLIREVAAEQDQSASTTFLIGLADPSSVGAARPFSATGPSDLALAVLANAASSSLAAQIFPQLSRTDADARLVRAACSESLDGGDDLDAMMLLAALEIAIASEEGAGVEEAAATTTSVVHVDVAVLVALKEEFRELHPWLGGNVQLVEEDGQTYYLFRAPGPGGPYQGVALFMGDMGPTAAAIISTKMMNRWQPATVALIGIAAGMHRDVGLGDVVVATQIDAYIERAKAVDEAETFVLNTAGEVYRADRAILGRVENLEFGHQPVFAEWRARCISALEREGLRINELPSGLHVPAQPSIREGHLASGPIVGASANFGDWLKRRDRGYLALEMESGGVLMAAHHKEQGPRTLVVRGISDFGDARKSDVDGVGAGGIRRWAMNNAIALVWALLGAGLLPRGRQPGGPNA